MLVWICLVVASCFAQKTDVIVGLGDSWIQFDKYGRGLGYYCNGKDVSNHGRGGTTAKQWAENDWVENALNSIDETRYEIRDIWLSVGGNDLMQSYLLSTPFISDYIETIGDKIKAIVPNAKIFMLGYSLANVPENFRSLPLTLGQMQGFYYALNDEVKEGAEAIGATYVETMELFGGSHLIFADEKYFYDDIHLNIAGYCNLWTQDVMQNLLECGAGTFECDHQLPTDKLECLCYPGNNCENDCDVGGTCVLREGERNVATCTQDSEVCTNPLATPVDDDECLQNSPEWGSSYTCAESREHCDEWAKDMRRCCPGTCKSGALSFYDCHAISSSGTCKYPNAAQCAPEPKRIEWVGADSCTPSSPCEDAQSHCTSNDDCAGDLICWQRENGETRDGYDVSQLDSIANVCVIPDTTSTTDPADSSLTDPPTSVVVQECVDNNEAAIILAQVQGLSISGCLEALPYCAVIPEAAAICPVTCNSCHTATSTELSGDVKVVEWTGQDGCTQLSPCQDAQSDCDSNDNCAGGLICWKRDFGESRESYDTSKISDTADVCVLPDTQTTRIDGGTAEAHDDDDVTDETFYILLAMCGVAVLVICIAVAQFVFRSKVDSVKRLECNDVEMTQTGSTESSVVNTVGWGSLRSEYNM